MGRLKSNEKCWCGSGAKYKRCHGNPNDLRRERVRLGVVGPVRTVPDNIARPPYVGDTGPKPPTGFQIQTPQSLQRHRRASQVAAEVLLETGAAVEVGVTTDELDRIAHEAYLARGAYPSTLGYGTYEKSVCTSVNGVICHGIPDARPLEDGDIVNVDVTAYIEGMHGDTSATFVAGTIDEPTAALVETTRLATLAGIAAIEPGAPLRVVAEAIQPFVESRGFAVVEEYGGHGIGETFHAAPHVNHNIVRRDKTILQPGMTLTVEPMVYSGRPTFTQAPDGWTEHTDDAMPSAQFEHTVVVTEEGVEILTVTEDGRSAVDVPVSATR